MYKKFEGQSKQDHEKENHFKIQTWKLSMILLINKNAKEQD